MDKFPKIVLMFAAVDWPIYLRRPMVYALAESAKAYGSTVVAINRPLCPVSTLFRKPRRAKELFGSRQLTQLADNLYLYNPRYFIHDQIANFFSPLERLNLFALRRSYRHLQNLLGVDEPNPLIWFNYPQQGYVRSLFDDSFIVFEPYDNLTNINGDESKATNALERKLRERVDLILTTSQKLHTKYAAHYRQSLLFGNGLSQYIYQRLSENSVKPLADITNIPSPRLGYAGMISDRLDWNLIGNLADMEPSWNFVFVGHVADPTIPQRMQRFRNIRFLGEYPHEKIPLVLKGFDIGLLPYLDNPFFHFLNPLKFYEMAAAGLPSVSSNIEELKKFPGEVVRTLPNRPELWRDTISEILGNGNAARTMGPQVARQYIWEDMTAGLLKKINAEWLPR